MPDADYHAKKYEEILEQRKRLKRRWGWLAHLIAGLIITFFRVLESILKIIFSILSSLAQGL